MIRETVIDGEPAVDVDTAEEFGLVDMSFGVYVRAPRDVLAEYGLIDTENSDTQDIVDESDWRDDEWLSEAEDSPGWFIRRLWAWVQGQTVPGPGRALGRHRAPA